MMEASDVLIAAPLMSQVIKSNNLALKHLFYTGEFRPAETKFTNLNHLK
jgi:hypothetical protein